MLWSILPAQLVVVLTMLIGFPAATSASPPPATPVEVAPGVPGNGRAWELVTSEEPVSAFLERAGTGFVAPSGDRIFYTTLGKLPDAPPQEWITEMASATRDGSRWVNASIPRPNIPFDEPFVLATSGNLGEGVINGLSADGGGGLLRIGLDGSSMEIAGADPEVELAFIGASEDLQRVYFTSTAHLLPADAGRVSGRSIYEAGVSGFRLVDADAQGQQISECGSQPVAPEVVSNSAVSNDGRRIYFATRPGCSGPVRVYLAEARGMAIDISASQCDLADCGPEADVRVAAVTPTGSEAYLLTTQRLTDEDTDSHIGLYRYDAQTRALTLLTPSSDDIRSIDAVHASADGSKVYFSGAAEGEVGQRLFEVDAGALHKLPIASEGTIFSDPPQISSDGDVVAFKTRAPLLPEDTDSTSDIYRYDDRTGALTLLSGRGDLPATFMVEEESMPLAEPPDGPYRAMSADGSRIFFTTAEALMPQDRNEVDDVYEWTEAGPSLISSGTSESEGSFLDGVVPDGSSAFFTTGDTLLPRDHDGGNRDIYAARIGGGLPEPPSGASCEGDACRNPVAPPIARPIALSTTPEKRIRVGRISGAARRRMAVTGWIALLLEAPRSGRLQARAMARIGRRSLTVAKTWVELAKPGPFRLRMQLSRQARFRLAAGRSLRLRLRLRLKGESPKSVQINLNGRR